MHSLTCVGMRAQATGRASIYALQCRALTLSSNQLEEKSSKFGGSASRAAHLHRAPRPSGSGAAVLVLCLPRGTVAASVTDHHMWAASTVMVLTTDVAVGAAALSAAPPLAPATQQQTPLFAHPQPFQQWTVSLGLGSQGPFTVVLDTGSADLIVNGPTCALCLNTSLDTANMSSTYVVNASAGAPIAPYGGFGVETTYGTASAALAGLPQVRDTPTMIATKLFNDVHRGGSVPTNGNPYVHGDGIMGFAGEESSFCAVHSPVTGEKLNPLCTARPPYIDDLLLSGDWAGEPSFSMLLPPYDDGGNAPVQAGVLTLGARASSGPGAKVTVPRADTLPALRPELARGVGSVMVGKWWFVAEDLLVNAESTGACQANSTVGGCLVFTDTGAPLVSIPPVLVPPSEMARLSEWRTSQIATVGRHKLPTALSHRACRSI